MTFFIREFVKAHKGGRLVQEIRTVTREGKTFQMHVWVDPNAKDAPHAQGGFDFDSEPEPAKLASVAPSVKTIHEVKEADGTAYRMYQFQGGPNDGKYGVHIFDESGGDPGYTQGSLGGRIFPSNQGLQARDYYLSLLPKDEPEPVKILTAKEIKAAKDQKAREDAAADLARRQETHKRMTEDLARRDAEDEVERKAHDPMDYPLDKMNGQTDGFTPAGNAPDGVFRFNRKPVNAQYRMSPQHGFGAIVFKDEAGNQILENAEVRPGALTIGEMKTAFRVVLARLKEYAPDQYAALIGVKLDPRPEPGFNPVDYRTPSEKSGAVQYEDTVYAAHAREMARINGEKEYGEGNYDHSVELLDSFNSKLASIERRRQWHDSEKKAGNKGMSLRERKEDAEEALGHRRNMGIHRKYNPQNYARWAVSHDDPIANAPQKEWETWNHAPVVKKSIDALRSRGLIFNPRRS